MFWSRITKIGIPLHTPVLSYKSGVQWGYIFHGHVFLINDVLFIKASSHISEGLSTQTCVKMHLFGLLLYIPVNSNDHTGTLDVERDVKQLIKQTKISFRNKTQVCSSLRRGMFAYV